MPVGGNLTDNSLKKMQDEITRTENLKQPLPWETLGISAEEWEHWRDFFEMYLREQYLQKLLKCNYQPIEIEVDYKDLTKFDLEFASSLNLEKEDYLLKVLLAIIVDYGNPYLWDTPYDLDTNVDILVINIPTEIREASRKNRPPLVFTDTDKTGFIAFKLAEDISIKWDFVTLKDTNELLYFKDGIYQAGAEALIKQQCQFEYGLEGLCTRRLVDETIEHIKRMSYIDRSEFDKNLNEICLLNGVLNIKTGQLSEHHPKKLFLLQIPLKYDKNATCPNIKKFLSEVLPSKEDVEAAIELFGYCLLRTYPIHKAFMFVGEGSNGKSTLINILQKFLGKNNCAAMSLQDLENQNFSLASLYGKLANLYPDLSSKSLHATGKFKMLTGEDSVQAQKKFKDYFGFQNYAKMIFSCNQAPPVTDDTFAFWRRWILINFPNQFIGDKANKNLIYELTTETEMSGLLNLAVVGLQNLQSRGDFANSKGADEIKEHYMRVSDAVGAFVLDCLEAEPDGAILKADLYSVFCEYCREMGYSPMSNATFHGRIPKHIKVEARRAPSEIEGRPFMLVGIKPRASSEDEIADMDNKTPQELEVAVKVVRVVRGFTPFKLQQIKLYKLRSESSRGILIEGKGVTNLTSLTENIILPRGKENKVLEIIKLLSDKNNGYANIQDVVACVAVDAVAASEAEEILENLKKKGEIYEPKQGLIRIVIK